MEVLTKPKNALAKQYERMFGMSRARMHITESARRAIAQAARERGTGARGLRSIMENLLQPVMFDVSHRRPFCCSLDCPVLAFLHEGRTPSWLRDCAVHQHEDTGSLSRMTGRTSRDLPISAIAISQGKQGMEAAAFCYSAN